MGERALKRYLRAMWSPALYGTIGLVLGGIMLGVAADEIVERAYYFLCGIVFACWRLDRYLEPSHGR
jgi:hypothetical protein